jgi:hypothetical protein
MNCPECKTKLRRVLVKIQDAKSKVVSYQCPNCDHFEFEDASAKKVISEIREKEESLRLKQSIIKLSKGRLGMYLNKDVARCLNLKGGEEVLVSIPAKNKIMIEII